MRIELLANRTESRNSSSFFRYRADTINAYVNESPQEFGNFSVSIITWATTFSTDDDNFVNPVFEQLLDDRQGDLRTPGGCAGITEVVDTTGSIRATDAPSRTWRSPASSPPTPGKAPRASSWTLQHLPAAQLGHHHDGFRLAPFSKLFRTFTINHSYRSTFSIGSYQTNLLYTQDGEALDAIGNFIPNGDHDRHHLGGHATLHQLRRHAAEQPVAEVRVQPRPQPVPQPPATCR